MKNHRAASRISGARFSSQLGQLPLLASRTVIFDALVAQRLDHVGIVRGNGGVEGRAVVRKLAMYFLQVDGDLFDVALVHIRHELREVDFLLFLPGSARLYHLPKQERREHDH